MSHLENTLGCLNSYDFGLEHTIQCGEHNKNLLRVEVFVLETGNPE